MLCLRALGFGVIRMGREPQALCQQSEEHACYFRIRCYRCANMYTRVKRVRRGDRVHEYVQLVEGRREGGKVRQRVVATLGRLDELKSSGQLERWAGAFARLDPPAVGTHRDVGPLLVTVHYLRRLGLAGVVDRVVPMRGRSLLTHGEVMAALVANRVACPAPLYDVSAWASSAAVAELLGVPGGCSTMTGWAGR